ncbi:phage terminase small subunit [Iodobacter sp.]|uniref:phage terminase small subunit n=1 Tax=Iodobacter sp. TaxID=1915058 RepID=UPI0025F16CE5|nr:phage terminase small subunit [Iodobacter sp.]
MGHARDHFLRESAKTLADSIDNPLVNANGYELMLHKLASDRRRLKGIESTKGKVELKRELLPDYQPWVEGALAGDGGAQDDVLMSVFVWYIDVGDFAAALPIAEYALRHQLQLPDQYKRTLGTLIVEEFADQSLQQKCVPVEVLQQVDLLTLSSDMPDQVRAKLYKALGFMLAETDKQQAFDYMQKALGLHDSCGVKKDRDKLERELKNLATASNNGEG